MKQTAAPKFVARSEAREQAFVILFEQVIQEKPIQEILDDAADARDLHIGAFTKKLVFGAEPRLEELDRSIEENLKGWNMRRISKVTLAILRLAVYEIGFEAETPLSVAINEAVELAKKYGGEKDASYVNGVLSSIAKGMNGDAEADVAADDATGNGKEVDQVLSGFAPAEADESEATDE